jgi:hypothetical protein
MLALATVQALTACAAFGFLATRPRQARFGRWDLWGLIGIVSVGGLCSMAFIGVLCFNRP